jgi:RHS repeat-associated protein
LRYVVDADGRTNRLVYSGEIASDYWNQEPSRFSDNLVEYVVDAFGRTNWFAYDSYGSLMKVRDVEGIETTFVYDLGGWMTSMTTPYGTTTFESDEGSFSDWRTLKITDTENGNHLWVYRGNLDGVLADDAFTNSFHWGPRQYAQLENTNALLSLTAAEYNKGRRKHWYSQLLQDRVALHFQQEFSPDGTTAGQRTYFDYVWDTNSGAGQSFVSQIFPLTVSRTIPDGTQWRLRTDRNRFGLVTNAISTYTLPNGTVGYRTNRFVYDGNDLDLQESYDADGLRVMAAGYANHLPTMVTNVLGEILSNHYNLSAQLVSTHRASGLVTSNYFYPSGLYAGWLSNSVDYIGGVPHRTNSFTYTNGLVWTHTDERGLTVTNTWDNLGRLRKTAFPDGTFITNVYVNLDLVRTVDRMGFTNGFVYDARRRLTDSYDPLGRRTHYQHCTCGALESVTEAFGTALARTTTHHYDAAGRHVKTVYPDNYWVTNSLNLLSQVEWTLDSAGTAITNHYNNQGLLYAVTNLAGVVGFAEFDLHDRVTRLTDFNHVVSTNAYDWAGRPVARGFASVANSRETFGYTTNIAAATAYTNAIGDWSLSGFDAYGRMTNSIAAGLSTNAFTYDVDGALKTLRDGNNNPTTWNYDLYGRVTNKVDALGAVVFRYAYDPNNRLTNRWTPAKGDTRYRYNQLGLLTNVDYAVSPDLVLGYDALNRLTSMSDASGATSYGYNEADQLLTEDGPWPSDTVTYSYTQRLRTGLSLNSQPSTLNLSYAYDALKRLTNITSGTGNFAYQYGVGQSTSAGSLVQKISLPHGAMITNQFDALARMTETIYVSPEGAIRNGHGYALDPAHQRTNQVRMGIGFTNTVAYEYDPLGQLTSAIGKETGGSLRLNEQFGFGYDPGGNLTRRTNNALVQAFAVNPLNQLTNVTRTGTLTVAGNTTTRATNVTVNALSATMYGDTAFALPGLPLVDGTTNFTAIGMDASNRVDTNLISVSLTASSSLVFDANGNLRTTGNQVLEYDDENQLTSVTVSNGWRSEFTYDARGRMRIQRDYAYLPASNSYLLTNELRLIYDGMVLVQERDSLNVPQVSYVRGKDLIGSLQRAGGIGGRLARISHSTLNNLLSTAFYHCDGNGNVTGLFATNGLMVAWYLYDPFGNTLAKSGPLADANAYRFSSKAYHEPSDLYYYGYRFLAPELQQWLNRDPMGEEYDFNLYRFVYNSPLNYVDPDGLWGIQFGDFNIGWGNPNLAFDWDSWNDLGQGTAATADGLIPFFDPFKDKYDPCDPIFAYSYAGGEIAQNALLTAAGLRAASWLGGTRFGHGLNHNPYLRIGPGRLPRNGPFPPSTSAPRISIGPQRPGVPNPHIDLRIRPCDL